MRPESDSAGEHRPADRSDGAAPFVGRTLLVLGAVLLGITTATAQSRRTPPPPPPRPEIKIGVAGPFSGPDSPVGTQIRAGVEQAIADINAAGGVLGQPLHLFAADDGGSMRRAPQAAKQLVDQGVKAVIGHFTSGPSIEASEIYRDAGVVQIAPAATHPRLTDRGLWNTFRLAPRDDRQGEIAGAYLARAFAGRRVAVVHDKSAYGRALAEAARRALEAGGLKPELVETITPGEPGYAALIDRLRAARIEAVYFGGLAAEAGTILRQMREAGLQAPFFGGDGLVATSFATNPQAEGVRMTYAIDPLQSAQAAPVIAKLQARGVDPEPVALSAYAAVQAFRQAAEAAKSADGHQVAAVMQTGRPFQTVIGEIVFTSKGDLTEPRYRIYTWTRGPDGRLDFARTPLD